MTKDRLGRKTLQVDFLEDYEKDRLKAELDLVALFASFGVSLAPKGKSHLGLCPWHDDSTPSLSVDRIKGLYNCFGCGESGDAFTLVQKIKGLSFGQALAFLKEWRGIEPLDKVAAPAPQPARTVLVPDTDPREEIGVESLFFDGESNLLNPVAEWYQRALESHRGAQDYLAGRGLLHWETLRRLGVGYAVGDLNTGLMNRHRQVLLDLGVLREDGREAFEGCLVIPLKNESGQVVSFYGRRISDREPKHLYLKGPHRGLVNRQALEVWRDTMILTESLLDGLSLITLGIENVLPCYGAHGFTADHLNALQRQMTQKVVLAFDADEGGRKGAAKVQAQLLEAGFEVALIEPVRAKDWNQALVAGLTKQGVQTLLEAAVYQKKAAPEFSAVQEQAGIWVFGFPELVYRVMGVKAVFSQDLKLSLRAECPGFPPYYDRVDFYAARSRSSFASSLGALVGQEPKKIEKDLVKILEHLEHQRDRNLKGDMPEEVVITEEDRALALEFLHSPQLMDQVVQDMEALGYAGEDTNKQLVYLASVSRLMDKPLSIYIQAGSGAGKSYLLETMRKLLPPEAVKAVTSFSDQALNYLDASDLTGKVFMIGEAVHNEVVVAQIRQMQSEGEIARLVTTKDLKTGEMKSREVRQKVRMSFMMSSTALELNPENASRCLILQVDESRGQTERVLEAQRHRRTVAGYHKGQANIPQILKKHQTAQRILEAVPVFNEYAPLLSYPMGRTSMRRSQDQFLNLIEAICLLRQYQKSRVKVGSLTGLLCDLDDYRIAYGLYQHGILRGYGGQDIPGGTLMVYELIRKEIQRLAQEKSVAPKEVGFIQRQVREWTGLGLEFLKKHLRLLVDFEYLLVEGGRRHGTRWSYRLREDAGIDEMEGRSLPTPQELEAKLEAMKNRG